MSLPRLDMEVVDLAAQRLASFEDGSVWPDSFDKLDVIQMRIQAERVIRSALDAMRVEFEDDLFNAALDHYTAHRAAFERDES